MWLLETRFAANLSRILSMWAMRSLSVILAFLALPPRLPSATAFLFFIGE